MTKDTKILVLILTILVVCIGGMFTCMKIYMAYFDAKFYEQVDRIEVGMSFEQVKEILPFRIFWSNGRLRVGLIRKMNRYSTPVIFIIFQHDL